MVIASKLFIRQFLYGFNTTTFIKEKPDPKVNLNNDKSKCDETTYLINSLYVINTYIRYSSCGTLAQMVEHLKRMKFGEKKK